MSSVKKIHYFQHVPFEGLGLIEEWIAKKGLSLSATKFYENPILPNHEDYDGLIIMGGSMSIHDDSMYNWLAEEKQHIKKAIELNKPILGICLGAQLIASVLRAKIIKAEQKEIGWFPIAWHDTAINNPIFYGLNPAMNVFHWHGEKFIIPEGAIHLASSQACENQAFLYNKNVLGLQFHLEMNEESIDKIIKNCGDEITISRTIQSAETIRANNKNIPACKTALYKILGGLFLE